MFVYKLLLGSLLGFALTGCVSTTQLGTTASERKQFIVLPEKMWHKQADYSYQKFVKKIQKNHLLVIDPKLDAIVEKFKPYLHVYRPDSKDWAWEIKASLNGDLNAYAFPGGKMIINTGILWGLKLTEDELAFVLAHEMAHILREHSRERLSSGMFLGVQSVATEGISPMWLLESEADLIAIDLVQRAGFAPEAALSFWQKFQQESFKREQYQRKSPISVEFVQYRTEKIQSYLTHDYLDQEIHVMVKTTDKTFTP